MNELEIKQENIGKQNNRDGGLANEKQEDRILTEQILHDLTVEQAIKISKILCQAKEERIPMVLEVFEKAGIEIRLDEMEEWKALKDQAYIIDMNEFLAELTKGSAPDETEVLLRPSEFEEICRKNNVKPSCAKRALHRHGFIKTYNDGKKLNYTVTAWRDGKAQRYVVILKGGGGGA